ncbi:ExeA family protein [Thauera sinica]|uniref:ExeA family protein n=1 Tax=Thauera sinica TaxID=2665146 RepID=A0ABW1AY03_9RHOO|nr:AAA family ATPase [Thauera sp. K11]ATE60144.1 hypothetical protein CCZ27_09455 [Thauera sp. K11]
MALQLKIVLRLAHLRQSDLARHLGVSDAAVAQILNHDIWPRTRTRLDLETAILAWLDARGLGVPGVFEMEPDRANDPAPDSPTSSKTHEGATMLLDPQPLSQRARERFGLRRNPFHVDLDGPDDVYLTPHMRERLIDMESAVLNRRFIAIYGESGSGKTELRKLLLDRVEGRAIVINPRATIGMTETDRKGHTLRIDDIYHAIAMALDPSEPLKRNREDRAAQLRDMLMEAAAPVCLVIEEAHRTPTVTLQSLKSLRESNNGWGAALGVLLIGQQELHTRLSKPSLREVGQRAERCELQPLGKYMAEYMAHRFARAGGELSKVWEPGAVAALEQRLVSRQTVRQGGVEREVTTSLAYPLMTGNCAVSVMNFAASLGAAQVSADIVQEWRMGA